MYITGMLIKFSKQIANSFRGQFKTLSNILSWRFFREVVTGFRGELRILPNISDGAFCKNDQKLKAVHYCANTLGVWQGSEYASELASKVRDVSFLNQFEY